MKYAIAKLLPQVMSSVFPLIDVSHLAGAVQANIILCQFSPVADLRLAKCLWVERRLKAR